MSELTFAFAATLDQRVQRWSRHVVDHGPGRVVDTVAERRSVLQRGYRILVVAADSRLADSELVEQLRAQGRAVMVVWDPASPRTKELAVRLGADAIIDADADATEFVRVASALVGERPELGQAVTVEPTPAVFSRPPAMVAPTRVGRGSAFRLMVCGPASEDAAVVAVELARAAAATKRGVVLVDANELNPSVVQRLNLAVLPNVRIAVDAVRDHHHRLTDALLAVPEGGFWVLGGLADPAQWAEVTPAEVAGVVDELAEGCEVLVIQGAPVIENLAGYGGPDRFGTTRRLLGDADRVVGVATATPAGLTQLAAWMAEVRIVAGATPIDVVLTRAPDDRFRRAEVAERVRADLDPSSVTLLPSDDRVDRAVWDGAFVRRGPFRKAVVELAAAIIPAPASTKGGRRG